MPSAPLQCQQVSGNLPSPAASARPKASTFPAVNTGVRGWARSSGFDVRVQQAGRLGGGERGYRLALRYRKRKSDKTSYYGVFSNDKRYGTRYGRHWTTPDEITGKDRKAFRAWVDSGMGGAGGGGSGRAAGGLAAAERSAAILQHHSNQPTRPLALATAICPLRRPAHPRHCPPSILPPLRWTSPSNPPISQTPCLPPPTFRTSYLPVPSFPPSRP